MTLFRLWHFIYPIESTPHPTPIFILFLYVTKSFCCKTHLDLIVLFLVLLSSSSTTVFPQSLDYNMKSRFVA